MSRKEQRLEGFKMVWLRTKYVSKGDAVSGG